jgi:large subunit ribosomal protein L6
MSRIGKLPVAIVKGVQVDVDGSNVKVKGPKGELAREVPAGVSFSVDDGKVTVARANDEKSTRALHGLSRSLLANMVTGVSEGFTKTLELQGVGYRVTQAGPKVSLAVGYSHPVEVAPPDGITLEVDGTTKLHVKGIDKELVGQVAANIRKVRKPEPYKGKGIRYLGEKVRRKAGKAGKAGK